MEYLGKARQISLQVDDWTGIGMVGKSEIYGYERGMTSDGQSDAKTNTTRIPLPHRPDANDATLKRWQPTPLTVASQASQQKQRPVIAANSIQQTGRTKQLQLHWYWFLSAALTLFSQYLAIQGEGTE